MHKQTIVGIGIIAGILIILASLTSVVGVQSTDPEFVDSPLFRIRTSNAIETGDQKIECNYIGYGKEIRLPFPEKNERMLLFTAIVNYILHLKDQTFNNLLMNSIKEFQQQKTIPENEIHEIKKEFYRIRENPEFFTNLILAIDSNEQPTALPTIGEWFPGCLGIALIIFIFIMIAEPLLSYLLHVATLKFDCIPPFP